jgi:hypothetical protein
MDSQVMNKESITQVINSMKQSSVVVFFCENKVDIDKVGTNSVDRTKPHLRQKCDPCLDRMQLELTDLAVLSLYS